jgi:hypothetical protein
MYTSAQMVSGRLSWIDGSVLFKSRVSKIHSTPPRGIVHTGMSPVASSDANETGWEAFPNELWRR